MKSTCPIAFCLGLLLAGCTRPDPRLAALEKTVAAQGAEINRLGEQMRWQRTNLVAVVDLVQTNHALLLSASERLYGLVMDQNDRINLANEMLRTNRSLRYWPANASPPAAAPARPGAFTNGVPVAVYHDILARARARWPDNYEMQRYTVQEELSAYRSLHR